MIFHYKHSCLKYLFALLSNSVIKQNLSIINVMLERPSFHLNERVGFEIDGGRGFVEHQDLRLPEQRPRQADELPLTHTQVVTVFSADEMNAPRERLDVSVDRGFD